MRLGGSFVARRAARPLTWSYTHGLPKCPLMHKTIGAALSERAEREPDKTAVVFPEQKIRKTYAEFYQEARELASGLVALGVERGDRVGIWAPNYYEWTLTQFATAIAGFVLTTINPAYQAHELEFCLRKTGVRTLITASKFKTQDYFSLVQKADPGFGGRGRRK